MVDFLTHHLCSCLPGDTSLADKLGTGSDEPYQPDSCQFQPDTCDIDVKVIQNIRNTVLQCKLLFIYMTVFLTCR